MSEQPPEAIEPEQNKTPANENRIGIISINSLLIRSDFEDIETAFAWLQFVPVRCEHHYAYQRLEYLGYSRRFKKVDPACRAPQYVLTIHKDEYGTIDFELTEQDGLQ